MADEQEAIGRDALEMSGLRASLQRRDESPRSAKTRGGPSSADDLTVFARSGRDDPAECIWLDGKRVRVVSNVTGFYVRTDGKPAIEGIGFLSIEA